MVRRPDKTLVDYIVIAISPALIMTLVGSLVFFLNEVFYQGNYPGRLNYILALFVFAAVLVGRISIEEGAERAALFAIPLGLVTIFAVKRFVEFQGDGWIQQFSLIINCGLIGLIWWSAHKLTWDCTLIDESQDSSGEGLLQAAGFDRAAAEDSTETKSPEPREGEQPQQIDRPEARFANWQQRLSDRRRRPHAPGVWVVYFSLAALPLFGIGQWFIAAADLESRRYAFRLLAIYTASGLGLLLTTSFLGLRRYLRQRRLPMPAAMAGLWLTIGCALIVALLLFAALLPRPHAEYAISQLPLTMGSPDQRSSRYGVGNDGVDEDRPWKRTGDTDQEHGSRPGEGTEKDSSQSEPGNGASDSSSGKTGEGSDSQSATPQPNGQTPSEPSERADQGSDEQDAKSEPSDQPQRPEEPQTRDTRQRPQIESPVRSGRSIAWLVTCVKYVFYAAVVVLAVYWLWRSRAELLAALQGLLQGWSDFWANLFGWKRRPSGEEVDADANVVRPPPRPFADYADPFASGVAGRYSPEELVRYSFEAVEAWACQHGCAREPDQTPHEFAQSVGAHTAELSGDTRNLADLYCRLAYASGELPAGRVGRLEQLWRGLRSTAKP